MPGGRVGAWTIHGATPVAYQAWLERLIGAAQEQKVCGESAGVHQRLERVGGGRLFGAGRALRGGIPECDGDAR